MNGDGVGKTEKRRKSVSVCWLECCRTDLLVVNSQVLAVNVTVVQNRLNLNLQGFN
jgi:hypothetical protein